MYPSFTQKMLACAGNSRRFLKSSTGSALLAYFKRELTEIMASVGDIYYAQFALMSLAVLGEELDKKSIASYLSQLNFSSFDFAHKCAFARALKILNLENLEVVKFFENAKCETPYDVFLTLCACSDLCIQRDFSQEIAALKSFIPRGFVGGYSNLKGEKFISANATAAAIAAMSLLGIRILESDALALKNFQDSSGGFFAQKDSPIPDMLTTAISLFALHLLEEKPKYNAEDFIFAHYDEVGSFCATLYEVKCDCEYGFYGLLALGALQ